MLQAGGRFAAAQQRGAISYPLFYSSQHLAVLALTHQGTEQNTFLQAVSYGDFACCLDQARYQPFIEAALHQYPRRCGTHLALVPEDTEHYPFHRGINIAVGEHNEGRFAAKFQAYCLDVGCCSRHDARTRWDTAGEGQFAHFRVSRQGRACCRSGAGDNVQYAARQPNVVGDFTQCQGGQWCKFGRLEHYGTARRQGRCHLPGSHQHGKVPGYNLAHYAHRFIAHPAVEICMG